MYRFGLIINSTKMLVYSEEKLYLCSRICPTNIINMGQIDMEK